MVALGKVEINQTVFTDNLGGCIWEIWKDDKNYIYGAHAYKGLNQAAKTIEGNAKFDKWKRVQRFETAGKTKAEQNEGAVAFSLVTQNKVETVVMAVTKDGKMRAEIERKSDSI